MNNFKTYLPNCLQNETFLSSGFVCFNFRSPFLKLTINIVVNVKYFHVQLYLIITAEIPSSKNQN